MEPTKGFCSFWRLNCILLQIKHCLNIPHLDMILHCMYILACYTDNRTILWYFDTRNHLDIGYLSIRQYLGVKIQTELAFKNH